jgi:hypothetical protein
MVCWRGFDVPPLGFRERSGTKRAARAATPKQSLPQGSAHRNGSEGFPRAEMETRIEPMDRRSKNEGGNANCNTTADSARDTENPPYKLTVRDAETFVKYKAASETRGPRLKVQADGATAKFSVDHPDEAIGTVALMRAIGTTDLDFYDGLIGHLVNASRGQNALSQNGANFMLSVVKGIQPRDPIEAMLAAQMAAVHMASMTFAHRLAHVENIPQQGHTARLRTRCLSGLVSKRTHDAGKDGRGWPHSKSFATPRTAGDGAP